MVKGDIFDVEFLVFIIEGKNVVLLCLGFYKGIIFLLIMLYLKLIIFIILVMER